MPTITWKPLWCIQYNVVKCNIIWHDAKITMEAATFSSVSVPTRRWTHASCSNLSPSWFPGTDLFRRPIVNSRKDGCIYHDPHDDDDLSPLQPKAFFTSEFIQWRVLSIHTNPYQALRCKQWNTNKENYSRTKSESDKIRCNNQILASSHPDDNEKSKASCKWNPPANHHTNVWIQVFHAAKLSPHSTTPPSPRAPPARLFTSSPATWSRSLSSGVPPSWSQTHTHTDVSQLADQMPNLSRQMEDKLR